MQLTSRQPAKKAATATRRSSVVAFWQKVDWNRFAGAAQVLANVATVLGVLGLGLAFFDLQGRNESDRAGRSIDLLDVWEEGGFADRFDRLSVGLEDTLSQLTDEQADTIASATFDEQAKLLGTMGANYLNAGSGEFRNNEDVDRLFSFFTRMAICVEMRHCSGSVAKTFLGETATTFWLWFNQYAAWRRRNVASFGTEFERYVLTDLSRP